MVTATVINELNACDSSNQMTEKASTMKRYTFKNNALLAISNTLIEVKKNKRTDQHDLKKEERKQSAGGERIVTHFQVIVALSYII